MSSPYNGTKPIFACLLALNLSFPLVTFGIVVLNWSRPCKHPLAQWNLVYSIVILVSLLIALFTTLGITRYNTFTSRLFGFLSLLILVISTVWAAIGSYWLSDITYISTANLYRVQVTPEFAANSCFDVLYKWTLTMNILWWLTIAFAYSVLFCIFFNGRRVSFADEPGSSSGSDSEDDDDTTDEIDNGRDRPPFQRLVKAGPTQRKNNKAITQRNQIRESIKRQFPKDRVDNSPITDKNTKDN